MDDVDEVAVKPPVESYCRATCEAPESRIETITGVEMRDSAEWFELLAQSKALMAAAIAAVTGSHQVANPAVLAAEIRWRIEALWPDRFWFLEVAWGERDGWVQIFQKGSA